MLDWMYKGILKPQIQNASIQNVSLYTKLSSNSLTDQLPQRARNHVRRGKSKSNLLCP